MLKSIKLSDIKKIDYYETPNDKRETMQTVFDRMKPDFIINGTLYDMKSGKTITMSEDENKTEGYLFSTQGIGIKGDKELVWTTYTKAKADDAIRDYMSGSPTLVINGKKVLDSGTTNSSIINTRHERSAIGYNNTHFFLYSSDRDEITCNQLADRCIANQMQYAINLDGGGSSQVGMMDHSTGKMKVINNRTENRPNPSWILIYLTDEAKPAPPGKLKVKVDGVMHFVDGFIQDGRTYIQIRELGEITGAYTLGYDSVNKMPIINTK